MSYLVEIYTNSAEFIGVDEEFYKVRDFCEKEIIKKSDPNFVYLVTKIDNDSSLNHRKLFNLLFSNSCYLKNDTLDQKTLDNLSRNNYSRGNFKNLMKEYKVNKTLLNTGFYLDFPKNEYNLDSSFIKTLKQKTTSKKTNYDKTEMYLRTLFGEIVNTEDLKVRKGKKGVIKQKNNPFSTNNKTLLKYLFVNSITNRKAYTEEYLLEIFDKIKHLDIYKLDRLINNQMRNGYCVEHLLTIVENDMSVEEDYTEKVFSRISGYKDSVFYTDKGNYQYNTRKKLFNKATRGVDTVSILDELAIGKPKKLSVMEELLSEERAIFNLGEEDSIYYTDGTFQDNKHLCSGSYISLTKEGLDFRTHQTLDKNFVKNNSQGAEFIALLLVLMDIENKGTNKSLIVTDSTPVFCYLVEEDKKKQLEMLNILFDDVFLIQKLYELTTKHTIIATKVKGHIKYNKPNELVDLLANW